MDNKIQYYDNIYNIILSLILGILIILVITHFITPQKSVVIENESNYE